MREHKYSFHKLQFSVSEYLFSSKVSYLSNTKVMPYIIVLIINILIVFSIRDCRFISLLLKEPRNIEVLR